MAILGNSKFMNLPLLLLCLLLPLSLHADAPPGEDPAPVPFKVTTVPYKVGPLDQITVTRGDQSLENLTVSQEGSIPLDSGDLTVKGLTPDELSALIRRHDKNVASVAIEEFRPHRVTVLGEVFHQIYTEMSDAPMRVLDAIASANGFTPLANTRRVKLMRENAGTVEIYELDLRAVMKGQATGQNIVLKAGDVITVPRNFL